MNVHPTAIEPDRARPSAAFAIPEPEYISAVRAAVREIAAGRPVVVVDDEHRENEGDLVFAAESATARTLAFTIRHGSGVVCVAMGGAALDRLHLPAMCQTNEDPKGTAYSVSVDAKDGVSTGISAADRARTIRLLANPATAPSDLTRPGHVFPLRARPGGVLTRPGHTEAAMDLTRLAGMSPAGAICEIVNDDGTMARRPELDVFCRTHDLVLITIAALIAYRRWYAPLTVSAPARLPTRHDVFEITAYRVPDSDCEHAALVLGAVEGAEDVLVRVHSECLTGDTFGSRRCDCGAQLDASMAEISRLGRGVLIYLRGHEGRGIGLGNKLDAYALQDQGLDTVEANLRLGFPADARNYDAAARILRHLGVRSIRLLSNNPAKHQALADAGHTIRDSVPLRTVPTADNITYLTAKRDRMGHHLLGCLACPGRS